MEYSYRFVGYGYRPRRTVTSLVATKMPVACACCSLAVMLAALGLGLLLPGCRIAPIQPVEESATSSGVPEPAPPASQPGTPNPPAAGLPALSVADVRAGEADGMLRFTVSSGEPNDDDESESAALELEREPGPRHRDSSCATAAVPPPTSFTACRRTSPKSWF